MIKDGINPPWKVLTTTMDKHHKLLERFNKKRDQAEHLVQHSKIDQREKKIKQIQKRVSEGNEVITKNIDNTENVYNSSNILIKEIEKSNRELMKTIKNLENFGTKHISVGDALKRAKEILKHVQMTSKRIDEQKDNKVFGFCSNTAQKVIHIYKPTPEIPKLLLGDLKYKLDDLANTTMSVENTCNIAEEMNLSNARRVVKIKEKIEKLKNSNQVLKTNVKDTTVKINETNNLLPALELIYGNLRKMFNFIEHTQLEGIVKQQMEENPQIEELSVRAMDHVQELEYHIDSYKR